MSLQSGVLIISPYFQLGVSVMVVGGISFVSQPCAPTFGFLNARSSKRLVIGAVLYSSTGTLYHGLEILAILQN